MLKKWLFSKSTYNDETLLYVLRKWVHRYVGKLLSRQAPLTREQPC